MLVDDRVTDGTAIGAIFMLLAEWQIQSPHPR